jgi:putative oxidoreductase
MNTSTNDLLSAVGRFLLATIFVMSGLSKIAAPDITQGYIASVGLPFPLLAYWASIAVELGLGLALVVGVQTRAAASGLAIFAVVTALFFHHNFADQNQMIHFLKNFAMAGGLLQVAAFGAGRFSVDAWRAGKLARIEGAASPLHA